MDELYKKYRPRAFRELVGQPDAVKVLGGFAKSGSFPHAILFTGNSGCGKTTLARIVAKKLGCGKHDVVEINSAENRGIDTIRRVQSRIGSKPLGGKARVWIFDEAHKMTNDCQNGILKVLEDQPEHAYFMLCTTDSQRLIAAIKTRCTTITVAPVKTKDMTALLLRVCEAEKIECSEEVTEKIIAVAEGSPRKALVILNQIMKLENEDDQLNAVLASDTQNNAIEIYKALINSRTKWPEMIKIIKAVTEEPEDIRRLVLACARNGLLGGGTSGPRAFLIINSFRDNFYDCGASGLAAACYEIITSQ